VTDIIGEVGLGFFGSCCLA